MDIDDDDEFPELVPLPAIVTSKEPRAGVADGERTKRVPVTILTGFLGSGKTTLLNYILSANHGKRIALIENEFSGGLGIEGMIAKSGLNGESLDGFYELNNGCICCSIKDDLLTTLEQLVAHKDRFDYIIIETTGVANPGPVITSLWTDDGLETTLKLDGVVCVVDSVNVDSYLRTPDIANDVRMQISYADRILLNKTDLVTSGHLTAAEGQIKAVNSIAALQHTSFAHIDINWVLDIDCYATHVPDASLEFDMRQGLITGELCVPCVRPTLTSSSSSSSSRKKEIARDTNDAVLGAIVNKHSASSLSTCSISFPGELDLVKVKAFLDDALFGNGARIGGGYRQTSLPTVYLGDSGQQEVSRSSSTALSNDVVLFSSAPAPAPPPAPTSRGHGSTDSDLNEMRIFRMKGILMAHGQPHLQVLQAVFDVFDITPSSFVKGGEGDATQGLNRIVVIGRNLDKTQVEEGFFRCLI